VLPLLLLNFETFYFASNPKSAINSLATNTSLTSNISIVKKEVSPFSFFCGVKN